MESNSTKYLQWKASRISELYLKERDFWSEDCMKNDKKVESLESKVQTLQAELTAAEQRERELKNELKATKDSHVQYVIASENSVKMVEEERKINLAILQQQLTDAQEDYEKRLTQRTQELEEMKSSMQADCDNRLAQQRKKSEDQSSLFKEQAQKLQCKIEKLEKKCHEMEEENKRIVKNFQRATKESEDAKSRQEEEEKKIKEAATFENALQRKSLQMQIEKLQNTIEDLKKREDLAPKVKALENTVQQKNKVIGNKNIELAAIKKEKAIDQQNWCKERDRNAILRAKENQLRENNKNLEEQHQNGQAKLQTTTAELNKANRLLMDQKETIAHLKSKVKASEQDLVSLRAKVSSLETYQQRFKSDLHACMSVVAEPKKLKSRIITLKRCYLDNDERARMDEDTESGYKQQVDCLRKKLECSQRIQQTHAKAMNTMEDRLMNNAVHSDRCTSHYIGLLNDKIREVHSLKLQLAEATLQLQKATKPAKERVRSWIAKKVLRTSRVAPEVAVEPPSLHPLSFPDENIVSSVPPSTEEVTSPAWQPQPHTDGIIIHVRPYVDDGLPPVHS